MGDIHSLIERAFAWHTLMRKWNLAKGGCHNCGNTEYGPMIKEYPWFAISDSDTEILCGLCMQLRAAQRIGRQLTKADFKDTHWNSYRSAVHSDF